jgi:hypothetical protein
MGDRRHRSGLWQDLVGSARHLECGAPSEGQQQQTMRVGAVQEQMCDPVGESLGLAGARTGRDQQRRRRFRVAADAVFDSAALSRVQVAQMTVVID